jgi:hypothetical protein
LADFELGRRSGADALSSDSLRLPLCSPGSPVVRSRAWPFRHGRGEERDNPISSALRHFPAAASEPMRLKIQPPAAAAEPLRY